MSLAVPTSRDPSTASAREESSTTSERYENLKNFAKAYLMKMFAITLEIGIPVLTCLVLSEAVDPKDPERFGLGWLQWTRLGSDLARESTFPSHKPSSIAQKRRMAAAQAVDSVTNTGSSSE